ncbi:MAG: hypothetical protein AAFZ18_37420, partial [Myxococcota bacterium]
VTQASWRTSSFWRRPEKRSRVTRYVDEFFVSWESAGDPRFKATVDAQVPSSANLGYRFELLDQEVAASFDVQNITDEDLFDFFGVQRPGRAFYVRLGITARP